LLAAYILAFGDYLYLGFDLTLMPLWMRHHLGAPIAGIGLAFALWAVPNMILAPWGGRIADRGRRFRLILFFGLAQVPIYAVYGLLNWYVPLLGLFTLHGAIYAMMQPAVDAHLANASPPDARGRAQSIYTGTGLASAFLAATTLPFLYGLSFRLPILTVGLAFGLCVAVGGLLVRASERSGLMAPAVVRTAEMA
jgi:MFS family permease